MRFSSDYQPKNRGRKEGSLNKANQIIRDATPAILEKVIEKAVEGDLTAASIILTRSVPTLKPRTESVVEFAHNGTVENFAKEFLLSNFNQMDVSAIHQALSSLVRYQQIRESESLEQRVSALEAKI